MTVVLGCFIVHLSVRKFSDVDSIPEKELGQIDFGLLAVPVKLCLVIKSADLVSVHLSHFSCITQCVHVRARACTCTLVSTGSDRQLDSMFLCLLSSHKLQS